MLDDKCLILHKIGQSYCQYQVNHVHRCGVAGALGPNSFWTCPRGESLPAELQDSHGLLRTEVALFVEEHLLPDPGDLPQGKSKDVAIGVKELGPLGTRDY